MQVWVVQDDFDNICAVFETFDAVVSWVHDEGYRTFDCLMKRGQARRLDDFDVLTSDTEDPRVREVRYLFRFVYQTETQVYYDACCETVYRAICVAMFS